jgi:NADH-quinone oxidoreductase subunit C
MRRKMSQIDIRTGTNAALTGFVGEVLTKLAPHVIGVERCDARRGVARIEPAALLAVARNMMGQGARFATATGIDARDGIDVLYHWWFDKRGTLVTLKALAERPDMTLDSLANLLHAANWIEREMHDLLGANFRGHPDMRRLILDDSWPEGLYPLRKDFVTARDKPPMPPVPPAPEEGLK